MLGAALFGLLGCGQPTLPEPSDADVPEATPARASSAGGARPAIARERPPSWAFYPVVDDALAAAFEDDARADVVLAALADTLAPYKWPDVDAWDNTGFVRIEDGEPRGFVSRTAGSLRRQDAGAYQLGCAGGFLEGVRAILVPALTMADLGRCDAQTLAMLGELAPPQCSVEDFGLQAIANVARALDPEVATAGPALRIHPRDEKSFAPLQHPGPLHVCTVSHESHAGVRQSHHMMIVLREPGRNALLVFDTTGFDGVALRRMSPRRIYKYVVSSLATNETYRYDPATTQVDCIPITRRR